MTDRVLTDLDDEGEITIFAKDSLFLFTCSKGHRWTVQAGSSGNAASSHLTRTVPRGWARISSLARDRP
jgi:hypothetical protein